MRFHKFLPVAIVYLFFDTLGLPDGLLYTILIALIFYVIKLSPKKIWAVVAYLMVVAPIVLVQLFFVDHINYYYYVRSFLLYLLIYIAIYVVVMLLKHIKSPEKLFAQLIRVNLFFTMISIGVLPTSYRSLLWVTDRVTAGIGEMTRLKMFSYEPSHYSTLIVPLLIFAFVDYVYVTRRLELIALAIIPLVLSFAFGVISSLVIAILLASIIVFRKVFIRRRVVSMFFISSMVGMAILLTDNIASLRVHNVVAGLDTSGSARFFQSNVVAYNVAQETNLLAGAGFGQSKLITPKFFGVYWSDLDIYRVFNSVAGTLAEFGLMGLFVRFLMQIFLFFRTKVYNSYFRLIAFWFIFLYQFTGSFTTNFAEYMVWIFAFVVVFPQFENNFNKL